MTNKLKEIKEEARKEFKKQFKPSSENGEKLLAYSVDSTDVKFFVDSQIEKSYLAGVEAVEKIIKDVDGIYCNEHATLCDHDIDIDKLRTEFLKAIEKLKQDD